MTCRLRIPCRGPKPMLPRHRPSVRARTLALALLIACEHASVTAPTKPGAPPHLPPPTLSEAVTCTATPATRALACGRGGTTGTLATPSIVVGGQRLYVQLTSSNVAYDAATGAFTFDVTLKNLTP